MSIKSELTKTASYLRSARNAIAGRGGEISATAGLKDLPMAIFNIPADSSLGFYSDNTVAYKKTTLANAKEKILLNEIGGMTYKSENLLNPAFFEETKEIAQGLTATNNGDGSITISGDGYVNLYDMSYNLYSGTRFNVDGMYLSIDKPLPENLAILALTYATNEEGNYQGETFYWIEGDSTSVALSNWVEYIYITSSYNATSNYVVADNLTIKPMLSRGSVKPYEPYFEGLRDSKVTALKVYGANLLDVSKCVNKCFVDNGDGTYTIKGVGTARTSEYAPVHIPANTAFYINAKALQEASKPVGILARLADGTTQGVRLLSERLFEKKFSSDVVGIGFYIQGSGTNADGVSGVYSDFWLSLANVGYFPYKAEPTTYTIPEAVQALDGYGEGFYTVYNQIRQNRITFDGVGAATYTKSCYRLILNGSEDWVVSTSKANTFVLRWGITTESGYTSEYEQFKSYDLAGTTNGIYMLNSAFAYITDKRYTTVEEFKAHLAEKPLIVLYSTTTPEVTDISAELAGFDPFIYVEPTGEIEFVNEYENAVPSTITYIVKAGS